MPHHGELRQRARPVSPDLSPVGKGASVSLVDPLHLRDGEGEAVGDRRDVIDLVERQFAALARFQILV